MTKMVFSIERRAKRATLSLAIAAVALLLCSAVALAEVRVGSDSSDTLVGTHSADLINGKGASDTLRGPAGNDTYHFANGFGRVSVEAPEKMPPLPAAVEVAAYRIAQEAITNVVRHAGARNCQARFDLDEERDLLRLEVTDDGRGIGDDRGTGVGLYSMRERTEELGGTCVVEPVPAGGTRVLPQLPCVQEESGLGQDASGNNGNLKSDA